jgi:hypothetical protein
MPKKLPGGVKEDTRYHLLQFSKLLLLQHFFFSKSDVSSPTILLTGSPTKVKSENDTKATISITNTDWNNLLKKYFVKI